MKFIQIIKCSLCFCLVLTITLLAETKIYGQKVKTIGIQSNFINPFGQQNNFTKTQVKRPDSLADFSMSKQKNDFRLNFSKQSKSKATDFFDIHRKEMGITNKEKLLLKKQEKDNIGMTHYRYQQTYEGIIVEGAEFLLHEKNGVLQTANGNFYDNLNINTKPTISEKTAIENAKKNVGAEKWMWENPEAEKFLKKTTENSNATYAPKAELIISPVGDFAVKENYKLCYKVNITAEQPYSMYDVYLDAHTGEIINKNNKIFDLNTNSDVTNLYLSLSVNQSKLKEVFENESAHNAANNEGLTTEGIDNAETLYSGTRYITTVQNSDGTYSLKDNDRNIETLDARGTDDHASSILDNDNYWGPVTSLTNLTISAVNNNWVSGDYPELGGLPEIFIVIKDGSNNEIARSEVSNKALPRDISIRIRLYNNPPYVVEIWDEDLFSNNDLISSFTLSLTEGTHTYPSTEDIPDVTKVTYTLTSVNNPALDVHWGMEMAYDFFKTKFKRIGFDGTGGKILSALNSKTKINESGSNDQNFVFGLGDGILYKPLVSLDAVGHEFTHRVINSTAQLSPKNESGALGESFADIFGTAIEYFVKPNENWTIGEDFCITTPFMRSLSDPKSNLLPLKDRQPDTYKGEYWKNTFWTISDNGGVHTNDGVQNFWFYLLSHGGSKNSPNDKGDSYNVTAIGIDHATEIAYRNLTYYLLPNANYENAVYGSKNAAIDLFGVDSQEETSVLNAWYAVGLYNDPLASCSGTVVYDAPSGSFEDGSGEKGNYQNNADCRWLIRPNGANYITLNFTAFNTEAINDEVIVYDGATTDAPVLKEWYGSTLPTPITSTTGAMLVRFRTNETTVASGWQANYTSGTLTSYCTGLKILNTAAGTFSDGSGSSNYGNNAQCSWLISPPGATGISLSFSSFDTEQISDGVIIYDGSSTNDPVLGTFSGTNIPSSVNSTGGEMLIVFTSNNTITAPGWTAAYNSTGSAYCSGTTNLTAASGSFTDGSGTNNYHNNSDCSWLIQPAGTTSITLDFSAFDLELPSPDGNSIYDYIEVFDGIDETAPLIGTYTGNSAPESIVSSGSSLFIHFHTDNATTANGWSASYTSSAETYCSGTTILTQPSGSFSDASGTGDYGNNSDCKWLIQPSGATSIVLTFDSFNTETNYDGVIIYDGAYTSSRVIATFTGANIPHQVNSTGGVMLVRFKSDGATTAPGWSASYIANISHGGNGSILSYEYWFDDNFPSKVASSVIPENNFGMNMIIPTDGLVTGLHSLHIRYKDNKGKWSSIVSEFFHKLPLTTAGSPKIIASEYWFDDAFASKVTTAIAAAQTISVNSGMDVASLQNGLHSYHTRYKDDAGQWSSVVSEFFHKLPHTATGTRKITASEYWFDDAFASKVTTAITAAQTISVNSGMDVASLQNGLHSYHTRYKDDAGQWSSVVSEFFHKLPLTATGPRKITASEYWFDDAFASKVTTVIAANQTISVNSGMDVASLQTGLHSYHTRYKDDAGQWSSVVSEFFHKLPVSVSGTNLITTYRYWFDRNETAIQTVNLPTPVNPYELVRDLNTCSLTDGDHSIHFQFRDSQHAWSSVASQTITKSGIVALPEITANASKTFCQGNTVTLSSSSADTYLWSTGATTANIVVSASGNYTVTVNKGTACEKTSLATAIVVNPLPSAAGIISGNTSVAKNQSNLIYSIPAIDGASSYSWTLPNGASGTSTSNSIAISFGNDAVSGDIKVKGRNDCGDGTENSLAISVVSMLTQNISLNSGWNIISASLIPSNLEMKAIFQTLIDAGKLKKVMDETGKTIENFGAFGGWKNNIGNLGSAKGYKVNVTAASTLSLEGIPVQLPLDISLNTGWNIISYPSSNLQDAKALVQSLIDAGKIKKIMDEAGKTIENFGSFGGWKNNIGNFAPGKGYKVNVTANCTLTIPVNVVKSAVALPELLASEHFKPVFIGNGTDHMNVHLVNLQSSGLLAGDEIGIFDGKLCVGSATIGTEQLVDESISIPASANDELTKYTNGYQKGHPIELKLYRGSQIYRLNLEKLSGSELFEKNGSLFAQVNLNNLTAVQIMDNSAQFTCFPNPFTREITIEVQNPKQTKLIVEIYSMNGQRIKNLYKGITKDKLVLKWNGTNDSGQKVVAGVYLCKVNGQSKQVIFEGGKRNE